MKLHTWFLFIGLLFMSSTSFGGTSSCDKLKVEVYNSDKASRPYVILGAIHVEAANLKNLLCKVKKIANQAGGDAVLSYRIQDQGTPGWGGSLHSGSGVVVRWPSSEEKGLTQISPDIAIPVIE